MAQADILTSSLRANPIFYADGQLVPYGHFSNQRPGGQTQYDVNVTYPLDVWRSARRGSWSPSRPSASPRPNSRTPSGSRSTTFTRPTSTPWRLG